MNSKIMKYRLLIKYNKEWNKIKKSNPFPFYCKQFNISSFNKNINNLNRFYINMIDILKYNYKIEGFNAYSIIISYKTQYRNFLNYYFVIYNNIIELRKYTVIAKYVEYDNLIEHINNFKIDV